MPFQSKVSLWRKVKLPSQRTGFGRASLTSKSTWENKLETPMSLHVAWRLISCNAIFYFPLDSSRISKEIQLQEPGLNLESQSFVWNGHLSHFLNIFRGMLEGTYYPAESLYTLPTQSEGASITVNFGRSRSLIKKSYGPRRQAKAEHARLVWNAFNNLEEALSTGSSSSF